MPIFGSPAPEPLENAPVRMSFRDGEQWVPAHLAAMIGDMETYKFTYAEAKREANNKATRDFTNDAFDGVIESHFRRTT